MRSPPRSRSARVRARLSHPVVDIDGHILEFMPTVLDFVRAEMSAGDFERFLAGTTWVKRQPGGWYAEPAAREARLPRAGWWQYPAANTLDRATVMLPKLLHERMDELGFDYAVLYPTISLGMCAIHDADLRRAVCRGFNTFCGEIFRPYADRLTAAGVIPMDTPAEAIEELEHCRRVGLKVVAVPHGVLRPIDRPRTGDTHGIYRMQRQSLWFDGFGLDTLHDYDPVWRRFVELGYAVTSHLGLALHSNTYTSPTNYSFNHMGSHAEAMYTLCKTLFLGGVTRRHPGLSIGFLECGAWWAGFLLADLVEHWEKRNPRAAEGRDPARVDLALLENLFRQYGDGLVRGHATDLPRLLRESLAYQADAPDERDDFRHLAISRADEIRDLFVSRFFFGCEADDRTVPFAFSPANAFGARLQACFSSDIGHWDVTDMADVVAEAWELVEEGLLGEEDFRDFMFVNPAMLHLRANPDFFAGTAVAGRAKELWAAPGSGRAGA